MLLLLFLLLLLLLLFLLLLLLLFLLLLLLFNQTCSRSSPAPRSMPQPHGSSPPTSMSSSCWWSLSQVLSRTATTSPCVVVPLIMWPGLRMAGWRPWWPAAVYGEIRNISLSLLSRDVPLDPSPVTDDCSFAQSNPRIVLCAIRRWSNIRTLCTSIGTILGLRGQS